MFFIKFIIFLAIGNFAAKYLIHEADENFTSKQMIIRGITTFHRWKSAVNSNDFLNQNDETLKYLRQYFLSKNVADRTYPE